MLKISFESENSLIFGKYFKAAGSEFWLSFRKKTYIRFDGTYRIRSTLFGFNFCGKFFKTHFSRISSYNVGSYGILLNPKFVVYQVHNYSTV